ncbi:hypothetical protein D9M68_840800 [compost metagenome]
MAAGRGLQFQPVTAQRAQGRQAGRHVQRVHGQATLQAQTTLHLLHDQAAGAQRELAIGPQSVPGGAQTHQQHGGPLAAEGGDTQFHALPAGQQQDVQRLG